MYIVNTVYYIYRERSGTIDCRLNLRISTPCWNHYARCFNFPGFNSNCIACEFKTLPNLLKHLIFHNSAAAVYMEKQKHMCLRKLSHMMQEFQASSQRIPVYTIIYLCCVRASWQPLPTPMASSQTGLLFFN